MTINGLKYNSQLLEVFFSFKGEEGFNMTVAIKQGKAYNDDRTKGLPMSFRISEDNVLVGRQEAIQQNLTRKKCSLSDAIEIVKDAIKNCITGYSKNICCQVTAKGLNLYNGDLDGLVKQTGWINSITTTENKPIIEMSDIEYYVYCPMCKKYFCGSDYLYSIFAADEKALWFANMVMHYRHSHITSWNKCWGYGGRYYRSGWFGDYDEEKAKVNERAKRQILRKCKDYLKANGFTVDVLDKLQNTTDETREVAMKILG